MKQFTHLITAAALVTIVSGCAQEAGTSSLKMLLGNAAVTKPENPISQAVTPAPTFSDGNTTFTITEAQVNVRNVILDDANGSAQHTVNGPFMLDLLTGNATPNTITFEPPAATYTRIDVRVDQANVEDNLVPAGDAMLGNSIRISGTYATTTPSAQGKFTIMFGLTEDIRFEPTGGIAIDDENSANIVLKMDVTDWLVDPANSTTVDLSACMSTYLDTSTVEDTTDVLIDDNSGKTCSGVQIEKIIKSNMKNLYDFSS